MFADESQKLVTQIKVTKTPQGTVFGYGLRSNKSSA
jgi:hypothetical protein